MNCQGRCRGRGHRVCTRHGRGIGTNRVCRVSSALGSIARRSRVCTSKSTGRAVGCGSRLRTVRYWRCLRGRRVGASNARAGRVITVLVVCDWVGPCSQCQESERQYCCHAHIVLFVTTRSMRCSSRVRLVKCLSRNRLQ